jgi:hypothetical protein
MPNLVRLLLAASDLGKALLLHLVMRCWELRLQTILLESLTGWRLHIATLVLEWS